jgi:hypothetical protein
MRVGAICTHFFIFNMEVLILDIQIKNQLSKTQRRLMKKFVIVLFY